MLITENQYLQLSSERGYKATFIRPSLFLQLLHSVVQWQEILASSTELFKEDPQSL